MMFPGPYAASHGTQVLRDSSLPDGTRLKVTHVGKMVTAVISSEDGRAVSHTRLNLEERPTIQGKPDVWAAERDLTRAATAQAVANQRASVRRR